MRLICAVRTAAQVWESTTNLSKSVSDQVNWETVQSYPKAALERVSTMTGKTKDVAQRTVQQKAE
jgi:hypothetical protein